MLSLIGADCIFYWLLFLFSNCVFADIQRQLIPLNPVLTFRDTIERVWIYLVF